MKFQHKSVLMSEVIIGLKPQPGDIYIDCTLGGGGHAWAILNEIMPSGILIGIDKDGDALEAACQNLAEYGSSFIPVRENFSALKKIVADLNINAVNGILFDFGLSSYQLDNPDRGFTYQENVRLDMRMDLREKSTAEDLINTLSIKELAYIIKNYGEERWAHRIAEFIVLTRERKGKIHFTGELVEIIKDAIPARYRRQGGHPARKTFQALRIAVNRELEIIPTVLQDAASLLLPGGKLGAISFHSLEDRLVKKVFRQLQGECFCPPGMPYCVCKGKGCFTIITKKPVVPRDTEIKDNPRARSAKLRIIEKCQVLNEKAGE